MNAILIVVERPAKTEKHQDERWTAFSNGLTSKRPPNGTSGELPGRIAETAWLIDGRNGLPALGRVLDLAHQNKIAYRVLFLDAVTEWVSPSKAT
jgi:hypothetical protein